MQCRIHIWYQRVWAWTMLGRCLVVKTRHGEMNQICQIAEFKFGGFARHLMPYNQFLATKARLKQKS